MAKEMDVNKVIGQLSKKVKFTGKVIDVKRGTVGLKTLARLDFLQKAHGYVIKYEHVGTSNIVPVELHGVIKGTIKKA